MSWDINAKLAASSSSRSTLPRSSTFPSFTAEGAIPRRRRRRSGARPNVTTSAFCNLRGCRCRRRRRRWPPFLPIYTSVTCVAEAVKGGRIDAALDALNACYALATLWKYYYFAALTTTTMCNHWEEITCVSVLGVGGRNEAAAAMRALANQRG